MDYRFSNIFIENKDILTLKGFDIDPFLLENNKEQINKIYEFYSSEQKLMFVNGFIGTGKVSIINYSTQFLAEDVVILKHNCFNSTILDDVLLGLFKEFRELSQKGLITPPKIKTDNFVERINAYFNSIQQPLLIIFNSFEAILDENKQDILDFIFHLLNSDKAKVIIIGRTYNDKLFEGHDILRITTHALDRKIFDRLIKSEKIKASSNSLELLYSYTRGYYYYTILTVKILQANNISLDKFLDKLKDTFIPFLKLLEKELLSIIPTTSTHLFWFLILIRQDISISLLKKLKLYNEDDINYLIENKVIGKEKDNIYIQDYFEEITKTGPQNLLFRLRQYLVEIYQSQLPLKPFERDICISRQTMRKEIEYHSLFLPKKNRNSENNTTDVNLLKYSKAIEKQKNTEVDIVQQKASDVDKNKNQPTSITGVDLSQRKNVSLNLANFSTFDTNETNAKSDYSTSIKQTKNMEESIKNNSTSLKKYITLIKNAEKLYQYSEVLELAQNALALKNDEKYKELLPFIYAKMANAYDKTAQHDKSLSYYKLLERIFENDKVKLAQIHIKIANILYETFNFNAAEDLYKKIIINQPVDDKLALKAYIKLINIAEEKDNEEDGTLTEHFNNAIKLAQKNSEYAILSELYFKYALMFDDKGDVKNAENYYIKSTETDNTISNKFLSSAYSNLASLAIEKDDIKTAIDYYKKSIEADEALENNDGLYDSALRLADILKNSNKTEASNYYKKAFEAAKETKDIFYIMSSALALGDFYFNNSNPEKALKHYDYAYNFALNKTSEENIEKIKIRLNDVKYKIGKQNYENALEILHSQNNDDE